VEYAQWKPHPEHRTPSTRYLSMRHRVCLLLTLLAGCSTTPRVPAPITPAQQARADGGIPAYTRADVEFMSGMIGHHAQAIVMSRLAPSRDAGSAIRILAERIAISQQDEIDFMSSWLRKRKEKVPAANVDLPAEHFHHGADRVMMPGMLTPEQMDSLSKSRGTDFDRLYLRYMIQHHRGALAMLDKLFGSTGAAQDGEVFRFASDVNADQSTEIERMQLMLQQLQKSR
jgi:uncharacterized protein (DUF305 family)